MEPASIFNFGNTFVLLGWILLLAVPNWKYTQTLVLNGVILLLGIIYTFLILKDIGEFDPSSFNSLENVKALFQSDGAVAAGWMHYLAFDLFVGAYIVRKSKELGLPRLVYSLILPFAFMFGPIGYVIFVVVRFFKMKSVLV
ncbi:protein of unknown function [Spirosomataceae bacterium TFI 002]|nr:protein of unknown function [Spirosomataceae bacterium TFI 002]